MIHVLPVSRSALHLRDACVPHILEQTLNEIFGDVSSFQSTSPSRDIPPHDDSESSGTLQKELHASRKRKRGVSHTGSSRKRALASPQRVQLFDEVRSTIASIVDLASVNSKGVDLAQAEFMKMALRAESAQASRILKFWLIGIHQIVGVLSSAALSVPNPDHYLDLSPVLEIWGLRSIDSKASNAASGDDFCTECLVPALALLECLKSVSNKGSAQFSQKTLESLPEVLDRLLAKHLLTPVSSSFFCSIFSRRCQFRPTLPRSKRLSSLLRTSPSEASRGC